MLVYPNIPYKVGFTISRATGSASYNLNNSAYRFGLSKFIPESGVLQKLRIYIGLVYGSISSNQILCTLASGSGNAPGLPIISDVPLSVNPTVGFNEFDFSSYGYTLQPGVRYWFIIRNAHPAPNTNYVSIVYGGSSFSDAVYGSNSWGGPYVSTDSGSTWIGLASSAQSFTVVTDSWVDGICYSSLNSTVSASSVVTVGVRFTTPSFKWKVVAASMLLSASSPQSNTRFAIYQGSTQIALGSDFSNTVTNSIYTCTSWFSSPVVLQPNTQYVLALVNGGANSIDVRTVSINNHTDNLSLLPYNSRLVTSIGSGWTDNNNQYPLHWILFLDADDPFDLPDNSVPSPFARGMV